MEAVSKLSAAYYLTVCLPLVTLTLGVKISQRESRGSGGGSVDQDVQNCTAPLCLPDSQCSYYSALIQSPNYPESYPANQDVYWFLKLIKNVSVDAAVITVEDFHLEQGHDWVNIGVRNHLDSRTVQESLTGILRRGQTFRIPFSFGFQVYVHFHSDNTLQFKGFRFSYTVVPKDPRRVEILKLTPASVLLRWDPFMTKPTHNITYKVYHGLYGEQTTLAGVQLVTGTCEYNLTGLMASTSYFAYVVALVNCGQEDIGRLVNFTTTSYAAGDLLPHRAELGATEVECGTVFVSWTSAGAAGGRVIGYRVRIVTKTDTQVKAAQVRYITLRNLRADQDYNVTATAISTEGEGPPSNQVTIRLQRCQPGEAGTALSMTPVLARELWYRVRSRSLLIQLPACALLDRIARQLGQNFSLWVLTVEDAAGMGLPSDTIPAAPDATYGHTDVGRRGVYVTQHHLRCCRSPAKADPLGNFGIFQVGGGEMCPASQACNGPLRSNTTYRVRFVLVSDGTPVLFSRWSEPFTTRAVAPHQEIEDGQGTPSPASVTISSLLVTLCLLMPLCMLGVCYWRHTRTDQRSLVWRSFALRYLNPVHLSGVGATHGEVTTDSSTPGYEGATPQH